MNKKGKDKRCFAKMLLLNWVKMNYRVVVKTSFFGKVNIKQRSVGNNLKWKEARVNFQY